MQITLILIMEIFCLEHDSQDFKIAKIVQSL